MRIALASLITAIMLGNAPAFAEPVIKTSMPAIQASLQDNRLIVRMERSLAGSAHNMSPRMMTVVGRDQGGKVTFESETIVTNRMTYARIAATPALKSAATVSISLR